MISKLLTRILKITAVASILILSAGMIGCSANHSDSTSSLAEEKSQEQVSSSPEEDDDAGDTYVLGVDAEDVKNPNYQSKYYIVVYTGSQSTVVYGKDAAGAYNQIIKCFTCSTGKNSSPTRTGMYKVKAKYLWRLLVGNVYGQYSSAIGNNYLFHSVPYDKMDSSTIDDDEYDKLGAPASHGCIRLCVRDSKWIFDNVPIGTQVNIVKKEGPSGEPIPQRNPDKLYNGWDPSDEWASGNPYFAESEEPELPEGVNMDILSEKLNQIKESK